ncbi:MAG: helix-turn-helix domain-containing protein [Deltaproteobacteria bacterium]|nr:helix-turn-helix domain-containing protein [Deltaproteobacteria bacterium]
MRNRIAERREQLRLNKTEAAQRVGTSKQHYGRLEAGITGLDAEWLIKLGKAFECRPLDLVPELGDIEAMSVPLVGYVGAGEKVLNFDDGELERIEPPPLEASVLRVRGDSMWPVYREGDLLFFIPTDTFDPQACLYRDCILQLVDGLTYVKRIIPGPDPTLFTLTSYRGPEIIGVQIRWASPVLWIKRA